MAVKIELEKKEIGWIRSALSTALISYKNTIENTRKSKKIKLKEKQEIIKDLMNEQGEIDKLYKFFNKL